MELKSKSSQPEWISPLTQNTSYESDRTTTIISVVTVTHALPLAYLTMQSYFAFSARCSLDSRRPLVHKDCISESSSSWVSTDSHRLSPALGHVVSSFDLRKRAADHTQCVVVEFRSIDKTRLSKTRSRFERTDCFTFGESFSNIIPLQTWNLWGCTTHSSDHKQSYYCSSERRPQPGEATGRLSPPKFSKTFWNRQKLFQSLGTQQFAIILPPSENTSWLRPWPSAKLRAVVHKRWIRRLADPNSVCIVCVGGVAVNFFL